MDMSDKPGNLTIDLQDAKYERREKGYTWYCQYILFFLLAGESVVANSRDFLDLLLDEQLPSATFAILCMKLTIEQIGDFEKDFGNIEFELFVRQYLLLLKRGVGTRVDAYIEKCKVFLAVFKLDLCEQREVKHGEFTQVLIRGLQVRQPGTRAPIQEIIEALKGNLDAAPMLAMLKHNMMKDVETLFAN